MIVLSLFDGISCGMLALKNIGKAPSLYFASEIDPDAISVSKANHSEIIHVGDVTKVSFADGVLHTEYGNYNVGTIDLLIGGSPCQGFSSAGKGLNFDDPRSKLFFEFIRIKEEVQPRYFMLENVVPKKKEWEHIISQYMGVEPVAINSRLLSAQDRKRLYWCNFEIPQPEDAGIKFTDISIDGFNCGAMRGRRINSEGKRDDYNKAIPLKQYIECRIDDKSNCVTTVAKDNVAINGRKFRESIETAEYRYLNPIELERLQTLPDNYTSVLPNYKRCKVVGNGWTVKVIEHIFKQMEL